MATQQMSRVEFLAIVRQLPERTPSAHTVDPDHSSKPLWIAWLTNYVKHGDHPFRGQRDARFIYNHWWNIKIPVFIWLAEASGVDQTLIEKAVKVATPGNSTTKASAIRRILPWELVAKHLQEVKKQSINLRGSIASDLEQLITDKQIESETTRRTLIDARLGQGQFRADLERRWKGLCAVTGCGISAMLRASHIKPWSESTNHERLDPANGLLLAAHVDALFDSKLISFADDGTMLVSAQIADDLKQFNLPNRLRREPTKQERRFLAHHRRCRSTVFS
jgi:HNH endonuclease